MENTIACIDIFAVPFRVAVIIYKISVKICSMGHMEQYFYAKFER